MGSFTAAGLVLLGLFQLQSFFFIMANPLETVHTNSQSFFAGNLFSHIVDERSSENVVFSPVSIHSLLALTYLGANGQTAKEIREVMHIKQEDKSAFAAQYANFFDSTFHKNSKADDDKPQLQMSTRLYVNNEIKILPQFNTVAKNTFGAEAENVDFSQAASTVEKINKWVEDQTEKKIKNLLQTDSVDGDTTSVLINTIYFKARWLNSFSNFTTEKSDFHVSSTNKVEVDTMRTTDDFRYGEVDEIDAKVLELPYENSDISMMVFLPNKIDGLENLERNLQRKYLSDISKKLTITNVEVHFPKFRIEFDIDLKETLKEMGCSSLFNENANLSGMFDSATPQKISDIKHKAILECNEDGSEAAASTYMKAVPMSLPLETEIFKADHPFVFMIRDKNAAYFTGHVATF